MKARLLKTLDQLRLSSARTRLPKGVHRIDLREAAERIEQLRIRVNDRYFDVFVFGLHNPDDRHRQRWIV